MKVIIENGRRYVLRFDNGEEVVGALKKFMADAGIKACSFSGIGSCSSVELGYYNSHLKDYRHKPFNEDMEVVSLLGNGAAGEDGPAVHLHGIFGRTDFSLIGGHVFKLHTAATCEIFAIRMDGEMARKKNETWNLKLLE